VQQCDGVYLLEVPTAVAALCADDNNRSAHQRLPKSKLIIVEQPGHSAAEPAITRALFQAVAAFE